VRAKSKVLGSIDKKFYYKTTPKNIAFQEAQAYCERVLSVLY